MKAIIILCATGIYLTNKNGVTKTFVQYYENIYGVETPVSLSDERSAIQQCAKYCQYHGIEIENMNSMTEEAQLLFNKQ